MIWLLVLGLFGCAPEEEIDLCNEWTWIDEESCAMEVCAEQGADEYECRDGECWCCAGEDCWLG